MRIKKVTQTTPISGEIVDSLQGSSTDKAPSIRAVNEALENVTSEDIYSTEEQKVGTWINGKPFYRKVISFLFSELEIPSSGYPGIYNFNIPNIEELLPFTVGSLYSKTRLMFSSFPCVLPSSIYYPGSIGTTIDTDKILVYFSSDHGIAKGVFILYYTKTTD